MPGHWEGDLLRGAHRSHVATLVERQSRYVLLVRIPHRDSVTVAQALARRIQHLAYQLAAVADVGSRDRDGGAQSVHGGDECPGVLL